MVELSRRNFLKLLLSSGALTLASFLEACRGTKLATPTQPPTGTPNGTPTPARTPASTPTPTWTPTRTPTPTASPTHTPTPIPSSTSTWTPTTTPESLAAGLENLDFEAFLDESARRLFLRDPESLTIGGLADPLGVREDMLTNVSDDYIRATKGLQSEILDLLRKYDQSAFTPDQALNAAIYDWSLDDQVRGLPFLYDDYLILPFLNGLNWNLQYLFTEAQPLTNAQDAQDYIVRLQQVDTKLEQVLDGLKRREAFGVLLPRLFIPDLLTDLKQYTGFIDSHPYYITLVKKLSKISALSPADRQTLLDQAKEAIQGSVAPGYQLLIDYFTNLQSIAPQEVGLWRFSNGAAYYAYLLRHYTTTEITAEEIHQLGLEHVTRLQAEIREAFGKLGYPSDESLGSLVQRLGEDNGYISGSRMESAVQTAIDLAIGKLDQAFDTGLKVPILVQGGEQGNYYTSAPRDGSRPPVFYAATAYDQPTYPIKSIAFHEAVPGHGYQFDVTRQLNLPIFREAFQYDAYVEGWALYAEHLMWELGAYQDDPAGNIGRLWLELLRAVRCVLDTGIHSLKWTFNQSISYMNEAMGYRGEGEVRRYIMWPAQATSYYVGYLKILDLRQKAKDRLGSSFDLKQFHHVLLGSGQVPLTILEQLVETSITQTNG